MTNEMHKLGGYLREQAQTVLDLSVYPELGKIFLTRTLEAPPVYFFPDTIEKLLTNGRRNEQYYYFATKLFTSWTRRNVDLRLLSDLLSGKAAEARVKLITRAMVDDEVYSLFYEKLVAKDLQVSLSPDLNLLGDIVGKIVGFAKKSKTTILMTNSRLVRYVRKVAPVFEVPNSFVDEKVRYFERMLPGLRKTRGMRWFIGFAMIPAGLMFAPWTIPADVVLLVVDP